MKHLKPADHLFKFIEPVQLVTMLVLPIALFAGISLSFGKSYRCDEDTTAVVDDVSYFNPLIYPGYTPELGFNVGGGALWSFKTRKGDQKLMRSSVPFGIVYGFKGAISIKANWVTYWYKNKLRIYSDWAW